LRGGSGEPTTHEQNRKAEMAKKATTHLSRRERQIMDVIFRLGSATVREVLENLPDPPGYSAVRATMRLLEERGHLKHRQDGPRYVYIPTQAHEKASRTALRHLLQTFFDGSLEKAVAAHLSDPSTRLTDEEAERLAELIRQGHSEQKQ
jgi:predicted transcriptional regulator